MAYAPREIKVKVSADALNKQDLEELVVTIADAAHEYCSIPGCLTKMHFGEAQDIIMRLAEKGFFITKGLK
jgi:hypothetical protein